MQQRPVRMGQGDAIEDQRRKFVKWYRDARKDIDPFFADRYFEYLEHSVGFPKQVVGAIDEVTDRICSFLGNPNADHGWDRRGMVVGNVQSGKTANYSGLICKAADAGYKLIVVIAGIHNNLRQQTQERVDAGFIGINTTPGEDHRKPIGVGLLTKEDVAQRNCPIAMTNTAKDFVGDAGETLLGLAQANTPAVFVVKKNKTTLEKLNRWVEKQTSGNAAGVLKGFPLLLIDDEADNASINTSKDPDRATTINRLIREFLNRFEKSTYVGYTATPFANIFIKERPEEDATDELGKDLFPSDFIYALDAPSNYVGAERLFGPDADLEACIKEVDDHEDLLPLKHKKDHSPGELPESLRVAIRAFILARAVRLARGHQGKHMSMLVNASRFTDVQVRLKDLIFAEKKRLEDAIRYRQERGADAVYDALEDTWTELGFNDNKSDWETVAAQLLASVTKIEVLAINNRSDDALNYSDYPDGRCVIAVGGFSLSRGLTLEGLMVSYLLRNTKMYDTLLQMGRWFGYRPDYEDLCRLFMTPESRGWYQFITAASVELRSEIKDMSKAGRSPRDFGLKVARHPAKLLITARNKMRSGTKWRVQVGLSSEFIETTRVWGQTKASRANSDHNFAAAKVLVEAALATPPAAGPDVEALGYHLWTNVDVDHVQTFLRQYKNREESLHTQTGPLLSYIARRAGDELALWDVAVSPGGAHNRPVSPDQIGMHLNCIRRTIGKNTTANLAGIFIGNKNRVGDARMEKIGLTTTQIAAATEQWETSESYLSAVHRGAQKLPKPPGKLWRHQRERPLLILHVIEMMQPKSTGAGPVQELDPVLAYSISFPKSAHEEDTVEYLVNDVWVRSQGWGDEEDEEDEEEMAHA